MMTERRGFRIRGRVQGVGFRAWVYRRAAELRLRGFARNEPDGSVTAVAEGAPAAVGRFAEMLQKGPALARVDSVEPISVPDDPLPDGFRIA